jgi:hypothetical protein
MAQHRCALEQSIIKIERIEAIPVEIPLANSGPERQRF